jgi:hypothetical protein
MKVAKTLKTLFVAQIFIASTALGSTGLMAADADQPVSRFGLGEDRVRHNEWMPEPIEARSFDRGDGPGRSIASVAETPAQAVEAAALSVGQKKAALQEESLISNEQGYFPNTIILTQGIPARIYATSASEKGQCIMLDAFEVRRQLRRGRIEEISFTPDREGSFEFHCPMNGARGKIVVRASR